MTTQDKKTDKLFAEICFYYVARDMVQLPPVQDVSRLRVKLYGVGQSRIKKSDSDLRKVKGVLRTRSMWYAARILFTTATSGCRMLEILC